MVKQVNRISKSSVLLKFIYLELDLDIRYLLEKIVYIFSWMRCSEFGVSYVEDLGLPHVWVDTGT